MSVMAVRRFILNMARRNGHGLRGITNRSTLCDVSISLDRRHALRSLNRKNGRRSGCLAMVNMTDSSHIHVRLRSLKRTLCHYANSRSNCAKAFREARQYNL
jgi:hypothetical protein